MSHSSAMKGDEEMPVPEMWRPTLSALVAAFTRGDFEAGEIPHVEPLSPGAQRQVREAIEDYGDVTLVDLTDDTWKTSVAQWTGRHWNVLVDLRTAEEGRSDLVLEMTAREVGNGYRFSVHLVYVP